MTPLSASRKIVIDIAKRKFQVLCTLEIEQFLFKALYQCF